MKINLLFLLGCFPIVIPIKSIAQGLKFEDNINWKQVKEKAQTENKYIFLDLFATWCVPCRKMDTEVYTKDEVGRFMNSKFISVKVQMDRTAKDNEFVKSWYEDAEAIGKEYRVKFYPTYIFLSPHGTIVYQSGGYQTSSAFIETASRAIDPKNNLIGMMESFKRGDMKLEQVHDLALLLLGNGQKKEANKVAGKYLDYLETLPVDSLLNVSYLTFIQRFYPLVKPNMNIFKVFYDHSKDVDQILRKGASDSFVNYVILTALVKSKIWKDGIPIVEIPDWDGIYRSINSVFGKKLADRNLNQGKLIWFNQRKDWDSVAKYYTEKIETQGIDTTGFAPLEMNNVLYSVFFLHVGHKYYLEKAVGWMIYLLEINPKDYTAMDTYAGLLYKIGDRVSAIDWQKKALDLAIKKPDSKNAEIYKENILKMEKNQKTW